MQGPIDYDETIKHGLNALLKIIDMRIAARAKKISKQQHEKMQSERDFVAKIAENPKKHLTAPNAQSGIVYKSMDFDINHLLDYSLKNVQGIRMLDSFLGCAYDYYNHDGFYAQEVATQNILKMNKIFQLQSATGVLNKIKNHFLDFASPERFAVRDEIKHR